MSETRYKLANIYRNIYLSKNKTTGKITKHINRSDLVSIGDIRAKKNIAISQDLICNGTITCNDITVNNFDNNKPEIVNIIV